MIAPVDGSGNWPAWITRVSKPARLVVLSLSMVIGFFRGLAPSGPASARPLRTEPAEPLGGGERSEPRRSLSQRAAQVVQEVEARDQAVEAVRVGHDRDPAFAERRDERRQAGVRR